MRRTKVAITAGTLGLLGLGLAIVPGVASAAACTSPVRYSATSNTIYLVGAQSFTPSQIKAACAAAPIVLIDAATKTWELRADLIVQNGATLSLHGDKASVPGEVNTLRMRSLSSNLATEVSAITSQYGTIDIDSVVVTSWDSAANAPDTKPALPKGAPTTARGRAYIRAISFIDSGGAARNSAMYIRNSEMANLGYYGAEAYGISYKARGCDHFTPAPCATLRVTGAQTNSRFHHNYMGTYLWGAYDVPFLSNEYDNNVMYGLDPHDMSRNLTIRKNRFHHNGDHGLICSQMCDRLTIDQNESHHNGLTPWTGPDGTGVPGQVHGIMLHRGVTNTVVTNNNVHDQPNGAGIAIFDTAGAVVTGNTLSANLYGVRLTVGSANNTVNANTIKGSTAYGIYMYSGSDTASYTTPSGRPTANVISNNAVSTTVGDGIRLDNADNNRFTGNTFTGSAGGFIFLNSTGNVLADNTMPSGQDINISTTAGKNSSLVVEQLKTNVQLALGSRSVCDFTSNTGGLFAAGTETTPTVVTPTGSIMRLEGSVSGSAGNIKPKPVSVVPTTGTASARMTGGGSAATNVKLSGQPAGNAVAFVVGGLTAGRSYTIKRGSGLISRATADGDGKVKFVDSPPTAAGYTYTVTAG